MMFARHPCSAACAIVLAAVLSGGLSAVGIRPAPPPPESGGAAAVMATGASAQFALVAMVSAVSSCPFASYGAHFYAPGSGKTVALTFDDGPGASTAAILGVLARYRVPATFFNIGVNVAARPALAREEVRDGYAMGNHTWNHPDMDLLSAAQQAAEMDRMSAELRAVTGMVPCAFRPPYGDYDAVTLRLAQQRRMGVWLWSVDTQDWMARGSGSSYWVNRIVRLAEQEGGALRHPIVLMHNQPVGNPATVAALPVIIRFFRSRGYRFVTL
jgi:peptidoglycan/xylan/chitin deacetylase (PgdA/CDA1 family)